MVIEGSGSRRRFRVTSAGEALKGRVKEGLTMVCGLAWMQQIIIARSAPVGSYKSTHTTLKTASPRCPKLVLHRCELQSSLET